MIPSDYLNFFRAVLDSDPHFILLGLLQMIIPTQQVLMTLIKSRENIFKAILVGH